jgi:hypothetical protein
MLRKTYSDRFGEILLHLLPEKLASKASKTFGLKVPTSPTALADSLIMMAGMLGKSLDEAISAAAVKFPKAVTPNVSHDACLIEIVCAMYAQAAAILGSGVPEEEQPFLQIYTAKSFEELRLHLPDKNAAAAIQELVHETSNLYFNDSPSLTELAEQFSDYARKSDVKKVQDMNSWMATLVKKAEIRILAVYGVKTKHSVVHVVFTNLIASYFVHSMDFFKTLRPVLDD